MRLHSRLGSLLQEYQTPDAVRRDADLEGLASERADLYRGRCKELCDWGGC